MGGEYKGVAEGGNGWGLTNNALIDGIRGAILGSWSASMNNAVEEEQSRKKSNNQKNMLYSFSSLVQLQISLTVSMYK